MRCYSLAAPHRRLTRFHPRLYAYDKKTGDLVAEHELTANVTGAPMTYMLGGKQYIVFPTGGVQSPAELVAMALP